MSEISQELDLIGLSNERPVTLKEAKRCFRRKSHLLLPEKSLGAPNAHARFEELNNAFVRVLKYLRDNNGDSIEEIIADGGLECICDLEDMLYDFACRTRCRNVARPGRVAPED